MILDKRFFEEEIETEETMLKHYKETASVKKANRIVCKSRKGKSEFYICRPDGTRSYISVGSVQMQEAYLIRFAQEAVQVLEKNLEALKNCRRIFEPYDSLYINEKLPKAYREASKTMEEKLLMSHIKAAVSFDEEQQKLGFNLGLPASDEYYSGSLDPEKIYQSHNYKYPKGLKYKVSNGLLVRSKGEMLIAEMLIASGIAFRYEEPLVLYETETDQYGMSETKRVVVHPDFTIYFPDGTKLYWEHFGMMDQDDYRKKNLHKMGTYIENNIYVPQELIITMDSDTVPFDNLIVKGIIDSRILPKYK